MQEFVPFQTTIWDLIKMAGQDDTVAVKQLVDRYRSPVISFLVKKGFSVHDAEDIAQEVFIKLFRFNTLKKADQLKGRFRTLVLTIVNRVINNWQKYQYRKDRIELLKAVSLDEIEPPSITGAKDEQFDRLWMHNIMDIAFRKLKAESDVKGMLYYDTIVMFLKEDLSYKEIAERLNKTEKDAENYVFRAKAKLMEYIEQEIAYYSQDKHEYEQEFRYLSQFLE